MPHDPCTRTGCPRCDPPAIAELDQQVAALNDELDAIIKSYQLIVAMPGYIRMEAVATIAVAIEAMSPTVETCAQRLAFAIARIGDALTAGQPPVR